MANSCFLGVCLLLLGIALGCGHETERGFLSENAFETSHGSEVLVAERDMESAGLRFFSTPDEVRMDSAYENQFALEHPFLTHSRKIHALRRFQAAAEKVLATFGSSELKMLEAKNKVARAKELSESELRRSKASNSSATIEGFELTEQFLDGALQIAIAQEKLAAAGLRLETNLGIGEVKVVGNAPTKKVRAFLSKLTAFLGKYRHELASPLLAKYVTALEAFLEEDAE